jgi:hypothetical protein
MSDGGPFATLWADFDLGAIRQAVTVALRIFLAAAAAFLVWLVSGPLLRMLYRLASRRPAPGFLVSAGRLASAAVVGILVFWYLPLGGGGGSGWGLFGGGGGGEGAGPGGPGQGTGTGKDKEAKDTGQPTKEVLRIEMVASKLVPRGDDHYYLIDGKEPRNRKEIKKLLEDNKGRWGQMDILTGPDTPSKVSAAVQNLEGLAREHGLTPVVREHYVKKE